MTHATPPADERVTPRARRMRRTFRLVLFVTWWLIFEAISWVGLHLVGTRYPVDPLSEITPTTVEQFLEHRFDPQLGWGPDQRATDINALGARSAHDYPSASDGIGVYGDSYTFCDGVDVADAWPTLLEQQLQRPVLNFGMQGYGTDQALLKLEQNQGRVSSKVAWLCIHPENVARCLNIYRGFYQAGFGPPKPRFELHDGKLELVNPWGSADEVRDILLVHRERLIELAEQHDYWYQQHERAFAWGYRFPYTVGMALNLPSAGRRVYLAWADVPPHAELYQPDGEGLRLMLALVERFSALGREHGFATGVVILPSIRDVRYALRKNEPAYHELLLGMQARRMPYYDMAADLAAVADLESLFLEGRGHYTRAGNQVVARALARFAEQFKP